MLTYSELLELQGRFTQCVFNCDPHKTDNLNMVVLSDFGTAQTVSHCILSTRIVLHTGRVLRRGPIITFFADVLQAMIQVRLRRQVANAIDPDVELQVVMK